MRKRRARFGSIVEIPGRNGYWCRFRAGGKPITRKGGKTRKEADEMRARVWVLVQDGVDLRNAIAHVWGETVVTSETSFKDLADMYLDYLAKYRRKHERTRERDVARVRVLQAAPWAHAPAEALSRQEIRLWLNERRRAGASDSTVQSDLSMGSAVLKLAMEEAWIDDGAENPFIRCRLRKVVKMSRVGLDLDEFQHLLATARKVCSPEAYQLILAAGTIGWRLSDFATLRWATVDLEYAHKGRPAARMKVLRENEKTGAHKVAFLTGPLLEWARARRDDPKVRRLDSAPVFTQPNGSTWEDPKRINLQLRKALREIPDDQISAWKKWGDDTYLPFSFHSLRHTANSIMLALGLPHHVVAAQLGHKSPGHTNMTFHYATIPEADLIRLSETVSAALHGSVARVADSA